MKRLFVSVLLGLSLTILAGQVSAQTAVMKQFTPFPGGGQGLYWVPSSGPISHIAFLVDHRTANVLGPNVVTQELPKRGFSVLGVNTRFINNEASVNWELIALDVRAGVRFLRSQPGITKVILIGSHCGVETA